MFQLGTLANLAQGQKSLRMLNRLCFLVILLSVTGSAWSSPETWHPDPTAVWSTGPGEGRLELRADYLPGFGVEIQADGRVQQDRFTRALHIKTSQLWLFMPFGNFEGFSGGDIHLSSDLSLRHGNRELRLEGLRLVPGEQLRIPVLQLFDRHNRHLANVTHIHLLADPAAGTVQLHNADVTATPELARILDRPEIANMPIGQLWLDLALDVPPGADLSGQGLDFSGQGLSCDGRPHWPQDGYEVDVEMKSINVVAGGGFDPNTGRLKITPAATLKNAGEADVPWFRQFVPASPSVYPHEPRDQHPFLVWNLYRIMDGRIEQLAASGVKHAFFTINVNCDLNCFNGNILWPGCEDTYGVSNNDSSTYQAPRHEIDASLGMWKSCGSFFDPECTGSQTGSSGSWNNRMLVDPAELNHGPAGAEYFLDAWYVIQFDVDIWNTMGYHRITPNQGGSGGYTFNPLGPFTQGPLLNQWVAEGTTDPLAVHRVITVPSLTPDEPYPGNMPQGHLRVLLQVTELDDGNWRYNYAVMNFDFDRGVEEFAIALDPEAELIETWMGGPPDVLDAAWQAIRLDDRVVFRGQPDEILPWFTLYNFELVTDQAPVGKGAVRLGAAGSADPAFIEEPMPAPGEFAIEGLIFRDRFAD